MVCEYFWQVPGSVDDFAVALSYVTGQSLADLRKEFGLAKTR